MTMSSWGLSRRPNDACAFSRSVTDVLRLRHSASPMSTSDIIGTWLALAPSIRSSKVFCPASKVTSTLPSVSTSASLPRRRYPRCSAVPSAHSRALRRSSCSCSLAPCMSPAEPKRRAFACTFSVNEYDHRSPLPNTSEVSVMVMLASSGSVAKLLPVPFLSNISSDRCSISSRLPFPGRYARHVCGARAFALDCTSVRPYNA